MGLRGLSAVYIFWTTLAFCFGANLYFSVNHNIYNPVVDPIVYSTKDALWCALLAYCFYRFRHYSLDGVIKKAVSILALGCLGMATAVILKVGAVDLSYLAVLKNVLLYVGGTLIFINFVTIVVSPQRLLSYVKYALCFALLVSIVFYFSLQTEPLDYRMFGTFGNPNSVGWASFALLVLTDVTKRSERRWLYWTLLFVAVLGLIFSASLTALASCILYFPAKWIFEFLTARSQRNWEHLFSAGIFILALLIASLLVKALNIENHALNRILLIRDYESLNHLLGGRLASYVVAANSVTGFTDLFWGNILTSYERMDSTFVAFFHNFGISSLLLLAPLFLYVGLVVTLVRKRASGLHAQVGLIVCLGCFFFINLPLQHQYELFPNNYLWMTLLALSYFLGQDRPVAKPTVA